MGLNIYYHEDIATVRATIEKPLWKHSVRANTLASSTYPGGDLWNVEDITSWDNLFSALRPQHRVAAYSRFAPHALGCAAWERGNTDIFAPGGGTIWPGEW